MKISLFVQKATIELALNVTAGFLMLVIYRTIIEQYKEQVKIAPTSAESFVINCLPYRLLQAIASASLRELKGIRSQYHVWPGYFINVLLFVCCILSYANK